MQNIDVPATPAESAANELTCDNAEASDTINDNADALEVVMEDAARVRGGEPDAELLGDLTALVLGRPADAAEERGERLAAHELHISLV